MTNGLLDVSTLTPLPAQPHLRLRAAVAAAWVELVAAVLATYGWVVALTDAYRDYATQERLFRQRYTTTYLPGRPSKVWLGRRWYLKAGYAAAAVPGTSNHGLGITVDVAGLGGFTGTRYRQFAALAEPRGWSNAEGRSIGEAWHWTKTNGDTTTVTNPIGGGVVSTPDVVVTPPTPIEEDDMPYTTEQLQNISRQATHDAVVAIMRSTEFKKIVHDQADLSIREQFAPDGEAARRLLAQDLEKVIPALLDTQVPETPDLSGDARKIRNLLTAIRVNTAKIRSKLGA